MTKFQKIARYEGVSQTAIAEYLGITRNTLTNWIKRKKGRIAVEDAIKIRDKFFPGYTIEQLFGE